MDINDFIEADHSLGAEEATSQVLDTLKGDVGGDESPPGSLAKVGIVEEKGWDVKKSLRKKLMNLSLKVGDLVGLDAGCLHHVAGIDHLAGVGDETSLPRGHVAVGKSF